MKKTIIALALLGLLAAVSATASDRFPDLELNGSPTPEQTAHLGVERTPFMVSDITAEYLFVEVFSMYCPICQREAPAVNALQENVRAKVGDRVRFIGIGAGNTPFEVAFYAKKYQVAFPLFHDKDFIAHKALGNVGTPAFYLVDLKNGWNVLFFHEGAMGDASVMADDVIKAMDGGGLQ